MRVALILLSVFAALVTAAALCDLIPAVRTWVKRIGIGSLPPQTAREKIRAVALRQLRRTPAVPVSDQTRFTLPERLRGTYKSRKVQAWQRGALLLGVSQGGDDAALRAVFADVLTPEGAWKQPVDRVDHALLAYAMLRCAPDPQAVRPAMDAMYAFLKKQEKDGTVPYDPRSAHLRYVDTLGMVCPFLALYAKTYDVPQASVTARRQLSEYTQFALHPVTGLPAHALRTTDGAPLGISDWGRGSGWYALALAEMLRCGEDVRCEAESFARTILPLQQPGGAWSRQLLSDWGIESTATAMLGHLCAVLYQQTAGSEYLHAAQKARQAIFAATRKNGEVDYAQGDTKGIGFYSVRMAPAPAAQGFALLLTEELV